MRNGIFHVTKEEGSDKVLGVAMWMRPQPAKQPPTWNDWFEGWRLYFSQVAMNIYYGRGGLNVKVSLTLILNEPNAIIVVANLDFISNKPNLDWSDFNSVTTSGKMPKHKLSRRSGTTQEDTISSISWLSSLRLRARALVQK